MSNAIGHQVMQYRCIVDKSMTLERQKSTGRCMRDTALKKPILAKSCLSLASLANAGLAAKLRIILKCQALLNATMCQIEVRLSTKIDEQDLGEMCMIPWKKDSSSCAEKAMVTFKLPHYNPERFGLSK